MGKNSVPELEVERALISCQAHSPEENRLDCLKRAWIPRWLLDAKIADTPELSRALETYEKNDLMHRALVAEIQKRLPEPDVTEVEEYLAKHRRDFEKPLRLRLFRILVSSKSEAEEVLEELGSPVEIEPFPQNRSRTFA